MIRDLFETVVNKKVVESKSLRKHKENEEDPILNLRKVFPDHVVLLANIKQKKLKEIAKLLATSQEILCIEFLDKQ